MKDESSTPIHQPTPCYHPHPPTPHHNLQITLAWVSLLAASWLHRGSSVISSDCTMRKTRVNAFVLCATVQTRYSNPLYLKALGLYKPVPGNETDH